MAHRYQVENFKAVLQEKLVFPLRKGDRFDEATQSSQHVLALFLVVTQLSGRLFLGFADVRVVDGN